MRRDRGEPRAGLGRLDLADDPLDLGKTRRTQRLALEGSRTRQQLIQDHAERVDVAPRVDVLRAHLGLLGAHVLGRADELALLGEDRRLGQSLVERLGDAEVDDLGRGLTVLVLDEDVARLEVAVDHALGVRVLHRLAHLDEQPQPIRKTQSMPIAMLRDGQALDQFHREPGPCLLGQPAVEDFRDAGVVHDGKRLPLGLKPRDDRPRVHARLDDLERDHASHGLGLLGLVDHAEAALAEDLADGEVPDARAGRGEARLGRARVAAGLASLGSGGGVVARGEGIGPG